METTHKYKNPPLVEAVFELFFTSKSWTPVVPGVFYNEIKEKFPEIVSNTGGFGISFNNLGLKIGGGMNEITQYKNKAGNTIIQLSNNMLTVNKLPKYDGWEKYLKVIEYAVESLIKVLSFDKVERIGLKFINKIDIQSHSLENLKKYLKVYPSFPFESTHKLNSIQLNIESPDIDNKEVLAISVDTLIKETNYLAPIIFQLYYTMISGGPEDYKQWLEKAHLKLYDAFVNSITDYSKELFDNGK